MTTIRANCFPAVLIDLSPVTEFSFFDIVFHVRFQFVCLNVKITGSKNITVSNTVNTFQPYVKYFFEVYAVVIMFKCINL